MRHEKTIIESNINREDLIALIKEDIKEAICNESNSKDKKVSFLQYLNTTILSIVGTITMVIFLTLNGIKVQQVEFAKELLRLKTIQDINVSNIKSVESRVTTLELNYLDYIKTWVDQNYIRKPQK